MNTSLLVLSDPIIILINYFFDMAKRRVLVLPGLQNLKSIMKNQGLEDDFEFVNIKYGKVEFIFNGQPKIICAGESIDVFDYIWLTSTWKTRDLSYAISLYLNHYNIPHTPAEKNTSKISDHMFFALSNIATPNTYFTRKIKHNYDIKRITDTLEFPIIVKNIRGACGKDIYLAKTAEELISLIENLPKGKGFMFQEYIGNKYDWGILVSRGEIVAAEKSFGKAGEFRNNAACGAKEVFVDLNDIPSNISEMALNSMNVLTLTWGRPDILIDGISKEPYLLEVNRHPGITSDSPEIDAGLKHVEKIISGLSENKTS